MPKFTSNSLLTYAVALVVAVILSGCPSAPVTKDEGSLSKPELVLTVASLNLTSLNKRIEKSDIAGLWRILKKEQVEVLAVQNLTRYPNVATRVDPVKELSAQSDWRNAFGEMMENSGRQNVNVVFTAYPIRSNLHMPFSSIKSSGFEGALQTVIDGGVRDIMVVSAQFPSKASASDQAKCISVITGANTDTKLPLIMAGNLPPANSQFQDVSSLEGGKKTASTSMQYAAGDDMKAISSSTVETPLGTVLIARFALYRTH